MSTSRRAKNGGETRRGLHFQNSRLIEEASSEDEDNRVTDADEDNRVTDEDNRVSYATNVKKRHTKKIRVQD